MTRIADLPSLEPGERRCDCDAPIAPGMRCYRSGKFFLRCDAEDEHNRRYMAEGRTDTHHDREEVAEARRAYWDTAKAMALAKAHQGLCDRLLNALKTPDFTVETP